MILNIPKVGSVELNSKLPTVPVSFSSAHSLYENFFVQNENGNTLIVCDKMNTLSLFFVLEDYIDEQMIIAATGYMYGEAGLIFHYRKDYNVENIETVAPVLDFLVDKKLILKVYNDELFSNGIASDNYVYVVPSLEKFSIDQTFELFLEYTNILVLQITKVYEERKRTARNGFQVNEDKKDYKKSLQYMGQLLKEVYYFENRLD